MMLALITSPLVHVRVDTTPSHRLNTVRPLHAIGAGIDSDPPGKIPLLYSPSRTRLMLKAGLGMLSYRLYTELSVEDWHWNPSGQFSNPARKQGYWTSDWSPNKRTIVDSWGYRLPHRGSTRDQGDDDDYSRIDDGDPSTYWKSNPYLTQQYTQESDALHPQWVVIDFEHSKRIDAIKIRWANPYATRYEVQYWSGGDAILNQRSGRWHTFPHGAARDARGGNALIRLSSAPIKARFFRVLMDRSSGTCDSHGAFDRRNCLGYAISEIALGRSGRTGGFQDLVAHSRCGGPSPPNSAVRDRRCKLRQTTIFASSIDPWHSERDRRTTNQDQPGLDVIARNPITRGMPVMYPVSMLYGTPENAVAEIRYLQARRYPISYIEMGEEADGQFVTPEDYGALYIQWARALHSVDPSLRLGGPVFSGVNSDITVWRDARGDASWLHRFLRYLKSHDHLNDLAFMSFEHYPFKGCDRGASLEQDLLREPSIIKAIVATWRSDGVPKNVPLFITESNFAAETTPVPKQIEGALWLADYVGSALSAGIAYISYYQYEAEPLSRARRCGWGGYGMFITDKNFAIKAKAAQFYGAQMLTRYWLGGDDEEQQLYAATTGIGSSASHINAYAAKRKDHWSIMLVNKDRFEHWLKISFETTGGSKRTFVGPVDVVTYGARQYSWRGNAPAEIPLPNDPPAHSVVGGGAKATYRCPPKSVTVLRGKL